MRSEPCHADQPFDVSLLHRGDKHSRRFRENPRRLEDDFGPGRNAERLDDGTDSALTTPPPVCCGTLAGTSLIVSAMCHNARKASRLRKLYPARPPKFSTPGAQRFDLLEEIEVAE